MGSPCWSVRLLLQNLKLSYKNCRDWCLTILETILIHTNLKIKDLMKIELIRFYSGS